MIVAGEGTAVIHCSPREVLEFALDLDRYRKVDTKFRRIHWRRFHGDQGEVRYSGTIRGIPTPADTQTIRLTRWSHLEYQSVPSALNRIARFRGGFECEERDDGTRVRHREEFSFPRVVGVLANLYFGRWLQCQVAAEVQAMKRTLEAGSP